MTPAHSALWSPAHRRRRSLGLLLLALCSSRAARADRYDDALASARRLEGAGQLAAAAAALAPLLPDYPEDPGLRIELGWIDFQSRRFPSAEQHYREALAIAEGSLDARLGLAWALQRQSRCDEARPLFARVREMNPRHAGAADGLAACPAIPRFELLSVLTATGHYYQNQPQKQYGLSLALSLHARILDRFEIGLAYRFTDLVPPGDFSKGSAQHDLYASAGYRRPRFGFALSYAWLDDQTGFSGTSHHLGAQARVSPLGDLTLDLAASFYGDANVLRAELGWRVPLGRGFSARPAVAMQGAWTTSYGAGALGNGSLTLAWDGARGGVFASGKYGEEFRPAYLSRELIYDIPERLVGGASAGGQLRLGRFSLLAIYEYDRLRSPDGAADAVRHAHYITLGASGLF